jgi:hypothetical protein
MSEYDEFGREIEDDFSYVDAARSGPPSVVAAVRRDLERYGTAVADTAMAALALSLADQLDNGETSATAASMVGAQLRETLLKLAEMAPEPESNDGIDELSRERKARRASGA